MDHRTTRSILLDIERKVDKTVTAIEDLTTAITELEADESAAAAEFTKLAEEITALQAGEISEAEVESLAQKAAAVGAALKAATPSE